MSNLVERLRWWGAKRRAPKGMDTVPSDCREAADRIEKLERQIDRFRSDRSYIIGFNDGWSSAVEEAATAVENISHHGLHESMWEKKFRSAATAIRALSESTPTLLQEQKDNGGKEGE